MFHIGTSPPSGVKESCIEFTEPFDADRGPFVTSGTELGQTEVEPGIEHVAQRGARKGKGRGDAQTLQRLDVAARDALSKCRFNPKIVDGRPQQAWSHIRYAWRIE